MVHSSLRILFTATGLVLFAYSSYAQQQPPDVTRTDKIDDLTRQVAELNSPRQELGAALRQIQANTALVAKR